MLYYTTFTQHLVEVVLEDESVSNVVLLDRLDGFSSLAHGKDLVDDGLDALFSRELEHGVADN